MKNIVFVIGIPCAGKSTYIKSNYSDYKIIDLFDYQKAGDVFDCYKSYFDCASAFVNAIKNNDNVVLEHTMLKAKRRKIYIDIVKDLLNIEPDVIVIYPTYEQYKENCKNRGVPLTLCTKEDYEEMCNILEIPTKEEGFDNINIIK